MTREEAIDYNKNLKMYMKISDKNNPCKFLEKNYIALDMAIEALKDRPHGEWIESKERKGHFYCSECVQEDPETGKWRETFDFKYPFCPNCGASMQANDGQVTGKLNSEIEYKAKVKELEDAIAKCEQAEKEFMSRTCKFKSPTNCDFCSFHSDCEEHWKEGDENET